MADKVKPTSKEAVEALKKSGIEVIMLTGDNAVTAEAIRNEVGIDRIEAEVMPADKQRIVAELKNAGKKVVMVGDGINDSPALMQADVGIAIGSGTRYSDRVRRRCAYENDLTDVSRAIHYSKRTIRNIKQNLFWAFFYNSLGIPLAARSALSVVADNSQSNDWRACNEFKLAFRCRKRIETVQRLK